MSPSQKTKTLYFNTAACGLISKDALKSGTQFYEQLTENSSGAAEFWRTQKYPEIKQEIAGFLDTKEKNIALIPNFSFGLNAVLQSLKGNEKILLYRDDYPSLIDPFLINHFQIYWLESKDGFTIKIEEIEDLIHLHQIDIFAISHVQWLSGFLLDLETVGNLCKKNKVSLIVDATQSIGALPIQLSKLNVAVFIASNYKWMNAGFGTGILFMQDSFLGKNPPKIGGYQSYTLKNKKFVYEPSLKSYEPGHVNMFGFEILQNAIQEKTKIGLQNIQFHNLQLTKQFLEGIRLLNLDLIGPYDLKSRSSIVFLKDENGLGEKLKEKKVVFTVRNGNIRLSFHLHNSKEEVNQLLRYLNENVNKTAM